MSGTILIVEDEPGVLAVAKRALSARGFKPIGMNSAEEALAYLRREPVDLVISDIQLPGLSGLKLCEILKGEAATAGLPLILLTVLGKSQEKIKGLQAGADDYIAKPFDPGELAARVQAVLRRVQDGGALVPILKSGPVELNTARHEVLVGGKPVSLRRKEYDLLQLFLRKPGKLLTRPALTQALWGEVVVSPNALEVHVKNLRQKLGQAGGRIETIVGEGYRWSDWK